MAVVAADRLGELADQVVELLLVHSFSLIVHHGGELRGLAGDAAGELLFLRGARSFLHALQRVQMAGRLVIAERERVTLVHGVQSRVQLQIIVLVAAILKRRVGLVLHVRSVLVRIRVLPRLGGDDAVLIGLRRFHLLHRFVLICLLLRSVFGSLGRTCNQPHDHTECADGGGPDSEFIPLGLNHTISSLRLTISPSQNIQLLLTECTRNEGIRGFPPPH